MTFSKIWEIKKFSKMKTSAKDNFK